MTRSSHSRVWVVALAAIIASNFVAATATAATFHIIDVSWPADAEFATAATEAPFPSSDRASSAPYTLSQTFRVDEAFDANSLFFSYRNKLPESIEARVQIFEVDDRFAPALPETVDPSDILFDATIEGASTLFDPINQENGARVMAQVLLGTPVSLAPTTGSAGYAIRVTDLDQAGEFRWYRRSGGNDLEGELYTEGNGYRNLTPRGFQRDYAVALSSVSIVVPEPSALALLGATCSVVATRRRVRGR